MFKKCGSFDLAISDHRLIYGVMSEKIAKYRPKRITFRNVKNTDFEQLNADLLDAPAHVSDL